MCYRVSVACLYASVITLWLTWSPLEITYEELGDFDVLAKNLLLTFAKIYEHRVSVTTRFTILGDYISRTLDFIAKTHDETIRVYGFILFVECLGAYADVEYAYMPM